MWGAIIARRSLTLRTIDKSISVDCATSTSPVPCLSLFRPPPSQLQGRRDRCCPQPRHCSWSASRARPRRGGAAPPNNAVAHDARLRCTVAAAVLVGSTWTTPSGAAYNTRLPSTSTSVTGPLSSQLEESSADTSALMWGVWRVLFAMTTAPRVVVRMPRVGMHDTGAAV
jgi:hypothetical protein